MTDSTIAVAQFAPVANGAENLATMATLAETAVELGATLIVFPEYSSYFSESMGPDWIAAAESLDGQFATGLAALANRHGIHVIAGMLETTADAARASNTVLAFSQTGDRLAKYRKLQLYDAFGEMESDWIVPGPIEPPELFEWGGFTVGIETCYDIRFPEVTRRLVDAGANLILLPSDWVPGPNKVDQWSALVRARAIENTVYIAGADQPPPNGAGNSMIVDPMGAKLASIDAGQGIAVAEISTEIVKQARVTNPALRLRRL